MIEGWMGKGPQRWLARKARQHKRIIEVGVWKGLSTLILAENTRGRVWAVDHWQGTPDDASQHALYGEADSTDVYAEFVRNTGTFIASGKVTPVRMNSVEAASYILSQHGRIFDFIFIDADHSYEGCVADIEAYMPLVIKGGMLAGHDYNKPQFGVTEAVDEMFGARAHIGPASVWSIRL